MLGVRSTTFTSIPNIAVTKAHYDLVSHFPVRYSGSYFYGHKPRGVAVLNRTIAEHIGVPPTYLAKVLQNLRRSNLLYSFRGKQGGFCLRERGKEINLMQIVHITEGSGFTEECVLGFKVCSDKITCLMHAEWLPIKQ